MLSAKDLLYYFSFLTVKRKKKTLIKGLNKVSYQMHLTPAQR